MAETSLQFVERTGRVASAPRNATASQPKGPTNVTTRMGMGCESSRFEKKGVTLKVMKKRALPPTKYATNANQNDALSCVIRFMRLEIPTPMAGKGCGRLLPPLLRGGGDYGSSPIELRLAFQKSFKFCHAFAPLGSKYRANRFGSVSLWAQTF
jgi:hypothetical protein